MGLFEYLSGNLPEDKFAFKLIEHLRQAGDRRVATYDADHFQLQFRQGETEVGYANLRNLYDEYRNHNSRRHDEFFRFAVRSLLASHKPLPEEFADASCDILLTVRNRAYYSLLELRNWMASDADFSWPYKPLAEHLGVGVTYDLPEAMVMLQSAHLNDWGVSFYEAFERALSNLAEIDATFTTMDDHSYASATGDHYDASRMLLPDLIEELTVKGDPVVLLPNRDRLLITGSDDDAGIATTALVAQQLLHHPRPVTGLAFVRRDQEWQPWLPRADHPSYALLKSLGLRTLQQDYQEQTILLQNWLADHDPPLRIADFKVHEKAGKQAPTSYCVWQAGHDWLLPKTDRVCFQGADQELRHPLVEGVNCSWDHVVDEIGDRVSEEDYYPTRFRVSGYPTPVQLDRLRRRAKG